MRIKHSNRARGGNRGGVSGGYERTDPDYDQKRIARMRAEFAELTDPRWRQMYLDGLSDADRRAVTRKDE